MQNVSSNIGKTDRTIASDDRPLEMQRKDLEGLIRSDPDFSLYREKLAYILWREGKSDQARVCYEEASRRGAESDWIDQRLDDMATAARPDRFAGRYDRYPDLTGHRQGEGGARCKGDFARGAANMPLVTIVTAVYDNDDSFQRCIASVRAQTWAHVEYIVIDGGSPAATLDVIRANEDAIDYWVSEPDRGIYAAMNKGITLARGDYICLLNSDDVYEPDFVARAVAHAHRTAADIVYTDYWHGDTVLRAQEVGAGLLLGHMNICHNTFLASRAAYDRIGPYDETFRIVSDAVWMRAAWSAGATFAHLAAPLFALTEGGLSSGGSEAHRMLFIGEVVRSYRDQFPQLSEEEARTLYLLRFDRKLLKSGREIVERYARHDVRLCAALRGYIRYCLAERANFSMRQDEGATNFVHAAALCDLLDIDLTAIRIETSQGPFHEILQDIDRVITRRKQSATHTLLHFLSVFSAPSETFIYDLVTRLDDRDDCDNFVLFEHPKLDEERPFDKRLQVAWRGYLPEVGAQIYKHIVNRLRPDAIVAHFAINEHLLHERIAPLDLEIPTIAMCHGIDVFALKQPGPYRDHVLGHFAQRPDTAFTAVSQYLIDELTGAGVDRTRIILLPNAVSQRFFENRKTTGYYRGDRTLKLIAVGRLIDWKGHTHLLDALARFRTAATRDVHLTIVYGNDDTLLNPLQKQAANLGLTGSITFEPFVDFSKSPHYFSEFDIYVHPSTYTHNDLRKSETFGVALLEAITAGLPVITTDAGGLPEVVGNETRFVKIVPHGNATALSKALAEMWHDKTAFANNEVYAQDRIQTFSGENQVAGLLELVEKVTAKPLRVAMFSTSTIQGAGYAAYRVHQGLQTREGMASKLFTTVRNHENKPGVVVLRHPSGDNAQWGALQLPPKEGKTIFTVNQPHLSSRDLLEMAAPADVISLHWTARFLSAENIATLTWSDIPVVMTIRDMMPLTGGCHYFHGCENWKSDCAHCPQINSRVTDFPAKVLAAKRAHWNFNNLTLVALSQHTRQILAQTPVFQDCRIEVIPNSIETDVFRPFDKLARRLDLGLPLDRLIIGYLPSFSSEVKGYRELLSAFDIIAQRDPGLDPFVMLVGNPTPATDAIRFDKKYLNYISDNNRLAQAYSAADVIIVPSLEETFSNTTAEAIACGVPVVGFRTGAIPDLVLDGQTGYTAEVGDVDGLADAVIRVLRGPAMRDDCRQHAEAVLPLHLQAQRYQALFQDIVTAARSRPSAEQRIFEAFEAPTLSLTKIAVEKLMYETRPKPMRLKFLRAVWRRRKNVKRYLVSICRIPSIRIRSKMRFLSRWQFWK